MSMLACSNCGEAKADPSYAICADCGEAHDEGFEERIEELELELVRERQALAAMTARCDEYSDTMMRQSVKLNSTEGALKAAQDNATQWACRATEEAEYNKPLRTDNARLREALVWFAKPDNYVRRDGCWYEGNYDDPQRKFIYSGYNSDAGVLGLSRARKALAQTPEASLAAIRAEERAKLEKCMFDSSLATGHGDSIEDLYREACWQIKERGRAEEREACVAAIDDQADGRSAIPVYEATWAIRARGDGGEKEGQE